MIRETILRILKEETQSKNKKVVCQECGWSWKLSEGGDDPYTCHKCGNTKSELTENDELTNRILDKISNYGIESLSKAERQYLDNKSQDIEDDEVSDIASIDTGYQFNDTVDDYEVRFIYNETGLWDNDPVEYKHTGEFFIDGEEYYATMYTDEDYDVHSFDLHDGEDYVEFDEELDESLLEFFQMVGEKIKQNMI